MPRVEFDDLADRDLARVFIAAKMAEARTAEALLTANDLRYVVQAEALSRTLFGSPRHAAVFYVLAEEAETAASLLVAGGLEIGVVRK